MRCDILEGRHRLGAHQVSHFVLLILASQAFLDPWLVLAPDRNDLDARL